MTFQRCLLTISFRYEQHKLDFPDTEDGGVALEEPKPEPQEKATPSPDVNMTEQQSAIVETPISPSDLLDTVYASLSALTTLAPLSDEKGLQTLGDFARQLTESKAPNYISLLPAEDQDKARISTAVSKVVEERHALASASPQPHTHSGDELENRHCQDSLLSPEMFANSSTRR